MSLHGKQILQLIFFYIIVTNTFVFCDESTFVCIHVPVMNSQRCCERCRVLCPRSEVCIDAKLEHAFAFLSQQFFVSSAHKKNHMVKHEIGYNENCLSSHCVCSRNCFYHRFCPTSFKKVRIIVLQKQKMGLKKNYKNTMFDLKEHCARLNRQCSLKAE